MHRHFGIGFGLEFVALLDQLGAQLAEILDDAVMHECDARGRMRMGIAFGRRAMRRPARVADAGAPRQRMLRERLGKLAQFSRRAAALDMAVHQRCDACGIIAAIFQPPQRLQNDRGRVVLACNADNSAHLFLLAALSARLAGTEFLRPAVKFLLLGARRRRAHPLDIALVMTLPAPTIAPSPIFTGATSAEFEPMNAPAPMSV